MKKYEGKTLEEILASVAKEKGCNVEDLHYHVVEEKGGIFGLGKSVIAEVYAEKDIENFMKDYLNGFFSGLELDVEVTISVNEEGQYRVVLNAENNAMLIGKNGSTLQALTNVLRAVSNAQFKRRVYVLIDINNYKSERYDKLKAIAKRIGLQVKKTKVDAVLDPMPNDERKIIHQYLTEMSHVRTISEGEGQYRHLKIVYDATKQ